MSEQGRCFNIVLRGSVAVEDDRLAAATRNSVEVSW